MEFWPIYHQYYRPVRAFIAALTRDQWAADDLVQETFLRVSQKLGTLKDPAKLKPWVFSIARNQAMDHLRRARTKEQPLEAQAEPLPLLQTTLVQSQLERQEMSSCVQAKIDKLPSNHRTVLILYDLVGLNHQEVSQVLGISLEAARARLHRARKALQGILEKECSFERDERDVLVCLPLDQPRQASGS